MPRYSATIRHHSISRARVIDITGTLDEAKKAAADEFEQEQRDYEIVVSEEPDNRAPEIVATKLVSARHWQDR
jgi:hypothetical protein